MDSADVELAKTLGSVIWDTCKRINFLMRDAPKTRENLQKTLDDISGLVVDYLSVYRRDGNIKEFSVYVGPVNHSWETLYSSLWDRCRAMVAMAVGVPSCQKYFRWYHSLLPYRVVKSIEASSDQHVVVDYPNISVKVSVGIVFASGFDTLEASFPFTGDCYVV